MDAMEEFVTLVGDWDASGLRAFLDRPGNESFNVDQASSRFFPSSNGTTATAVSYLVEEDFSGYTWNESSTDALRVLVAHGADLLLEPSCGHSYLHYAMTGAVPVLLELGASVSATDDQGRTPLHTQCLRGPVCRALLAAGADPNARDHDGETALHSMFLPARLEIFLRQPPGPSEQILRGLVDSMEALLSAGADLFLPNNAGFTPLHSLMGGGYGGYGPSEHVMSVRRDWQALAIDWLSTKIACADDLLASVESCSPDFAVEFSPATVGGNVTPTKSIKVHKDLLRARSHMFRAMFGSAMKESATGVVTLPWSSQPAIERLIEFLRGRLCRVDTFEEAGELARLADEYLVPSLTAYCDRVLCRKLCKANAVESLLLANSLRLHGLFSAACQFVAENLDDVADKESIDELTATKSFVSGLPLLRDVMQQRRTTTERKRKNDENAESCEES